MSNQVRHIAMLLFAADSVAAQDFRESTAALKHAYRYFRTVDTDPMWANGRHEGDCTKTAHTCGRCLVEHFEQKARELLEENE